MKGHIADPDPFFAEFIKQFVGKMQSRSRCGGGSEFMSIDRLITLLIFQFGGDIRGQRHFADFVQRGVNVFFRYQFNNTVSVFRDIDDFSFQDPLAEGKARADLRFAAGLDQRFPPVVFDLTQKQELHSRSRVVFCAVDASGDDA